MLMNRSEQSARSPTWSASSVDIPCPIDRLDPELDRQKGEDLRLPQSGYSVHSSVASTREIEKSLNLAARTVLDVTHCNAHAPY